MAPETVAALIADARLLFDADPALEITLEANPTSVEAGKLAAFSGGGGQSGVVGGCRVWTRRRCRMLGREHSAAQAIAALELARGIFPRLSFDLIYARPGQTMAAWQAELYRALDLAGGSSVAVPI